MDLAWLQLDLAQRLLAGVESLLASAELPAATYA